MSAPHDRLWENSEYTQYQRIQKTQGLIYNSELEIDTGRYGDTKRGSETHAKLNTPANMSRASASV